MSFNAYFYLTLILLSTALLIFTLWKHRDPKLFLLYLAMGGLTYIYEYIIFILFKSYNYHPEILTNEFYDSIIGAISSNGFTIPILTVFVAAFQISWIGRLALALFIMLVETLFLNLALYEHYWYKTIYTGIGLLIAFYISTHWLWFLRNDLSKRISFLTLTLSVYFIISSFIFISSGILGKFIYTIGWFDNPFRDSVAFFTLLNLLDAFILSYIMTYRLSWSWIIGGMICLNMIDYLFYRLNLLILLDSSLWFFPIAQAPLFGIAYLLIRLLNSSKSITALI